MLISLSLLPAHASLLPEADRVAIRRSQTEGSRRPDKQEELRCDRIGCVASDCRGFLERMAWYCEGRGLEGEVEWRGAGSGMGSDGR